MRRNAIVSVKLRTRKSISVAMGVALLCTGCGVSSAVLNPAFVNTVSGGVVPVTPGPGADFILVRGHNDTSQPIEFIVTIEREVLVLDEEGNIQFDDLGNFVTQSVRQTVQLNTFPGGLTNDLGVVFPCAQSPITLVGLGENLLPTDAAVFVGGGGPAGIEGFGVTAENLNPLSLEAGNFNCGDTIIFDAIQSTGVPGGVAVTAFLLPGSEQPSVFQGPDTFVNLEQFLQSQVREDE